MAHRSVRDSSMHCLKVVDVDEELVDDLWKQVSGIGSYYSIGDGFSREVFQRMLYHSNFVLQAPSLTIRLVAEKDYLEVHPIAFGNSVFRHAVCAMEDIAELRDSIFKGREICCIIPDGMRGAKRLAQAAGMTETNKCIRELSGVVIACTVFTWRQ